jgi:hypothetical protein
MYFAYNLVLPTSSVSKGSYNANASPPTAIRAPAQGPLVIIATAAALLVELPVRLVAAA